MEFTSGQLCLFCLRVLLVAALPFAAFFYLKRRHGGRFFPVLVGTVTVLLILVPRGMMRSTFVRGADSVTAKWLTVWVIGAAFEECGRYIALRFALQNYTTRTDALCCGIGHGAAEVLMSAAFQLEILLEVLTLNGTPERLAAFAEQGVGTAVLVVLGNAGNLAFHMGMSALVGRAVHTGGAKRILPLAVFTHTLADYTEFCFGEIASLMLTLVIIGAVYLLLRHDDGQLPDS